MSLCTGNVGMPTRANSFFLPFFIYMHTEATLSMHTEATS